MNSILKKLFSSESKTISLQLGRFTDHYKEQSKYIDWDNAIDLHSKNDYFSSVTKFLSYLNIDGQDNVVITEQSATKLRFKIYQGSKCVNGFANEDGLFAEVKLGHCTYIENDLLKLLLNKNYELQYSSFAMDSDDNICMTFYADNESASPYKLFYGLKELATTSDKNDDVLSKKYKCITPINDGFIMQLTEEEKNCRYRLINRKIENATTLLEKHRNEFKQLVALKSYIIQSAALIIDYLVKPEGLLMEKIESIYKTGHSTGKLKLEDRIDSLELYLMDMKAISKEDIFDELYNNKSTFGNLNSCSHSKVSDIIQQEMVHYDWYYQNGFKEVVLAIPLFISSSLLYNYALPFPDKLYLELLIRILENDFFVENGYVSLIEKNGSLNRKNIVIELNRIDQKCISLFDNYVVNTSFLRYENIYTFCKSYLDSLLTINPTRK